MLSIGVIANECGQNTPKLGGPLYENFKRSVLFTASSLPVTSNVSKSATYKTFSESVQIKEG